MSGVPLALTLPLSGTRLIEASAGTGKTYTLVLLLLRAIVVERCRPRDLVAVTFTRAAAGELRERTRAALAAAARRAADPDAKIPEHLAAAIDMLIEQVRSAPDNDETRSQLARRLRAAELGIDELWLSTLHGFCQRLLTEFGPQLGVPGIGDEVDAGDDLFAQVCADAWRQLQSINNDEAAILMAGQFAGPAELVAAMKPLVALAADALLPPLADGSEIEAAWRSYLAAWRDAQTHADGYDELAALIAQRKVYDISASQSSGLSDDALSKSRNQLIAYFRSPPGSRAFAGDLQKLTSSGLAQLQNKRSAAKGVPLPAHPLADALQALLDADRDWRMQIQVGLLHRLHRQVRERLAQAALEQGRARFDDLVGQLAALIAGPAGKRLRELALARWRLALIDEFQDTDADQYAIFHGLFAGRLILVGDPKQAIYRFRGGDVHAYRRAAQQADGEHRLSDCHRSEPAIVAAINRLFGRERVAQPFREAFIAYHPVACAYDSGRHGELREADGRPAAGLWLWPLPGEKNGVWSNKGLAERTVLAHVGEAIVTLLDPAAGPRRHRVGAAEPLRPGDIAVLCQKNQQCDAVAAELRRRGIPVSLAADRDTESAAAEDIRRLLAAWLVPGDVGRLRALALSGLYGLDLARLDGDSEESPLSREQLAGHAEQLRLVEAGELGRALLLAVRAGAAAARRQPGAEARIDAWLRLVDHLVAWSGPGIGLNEVYLRYRRWQAGQGRDDKVARPVAALDAVQVLTMHSSKGLEFGVVFAPFLWHQSRGDKPGEPGARRPVRFHDDDGRLRFDLGGPDYETNHARGRGEELAEAVRVAYVALTRARHRLYLPVLVGSGWDDSALARLLPELDRGSAGELEAVIQGLASSEPGAIRVELPASGDARWAPASAGVTADAIPRALRLSQPVPDSFRLLSYSRLTRGLIDLPQDHEQQSIRVSELTEAAPEVEWRPRGAAFGSCFHALMERMDPVTPEPGLLAQIAADHGFGGERERAFLDQLWRDTVSASLPGATTIATLPAAARAIELEFFLPLRDFDAASLGEVLAREPRHRRPPERWPATLAAARGYLRGFIDLLYHADGRYYVLDYKTNDLGTETADYEAGALATAIFDHDYDLQYLIYLIALQRLLRSRLGSNYDYERDIGGAVYLFVRGLASGGGLYVDRPPRSLIDALESVFCGASA